MKTLVALILLATAGTASAAAPAAGPQTAKPATPPSVEASTGAERQLTISDLYNGTKYRDPFLPAGAAAAAPSEADKESQKEAEEAEMEFSIHSLNLKGIMQDRRGVSATLVHVKTGQGYILRSGKLFDYKSHRVPGVSGTIQSAKKSV